MELIYALDVEKDIFFLRWGNEIQILMLQYIIYLWFDQCYHALSCFIYVNLKYFLKTQALKKNKNTLVSFYALKNFIFFGLPHIKKCQFF